MFSQESSGWTLQSCIDYALENNDDIQLSKVDRQIADVEVKSAKGAWLPSLSFSSNQSYGNHPYGDPANSYNGSYNFSANWTVFDGSRTSAIDAAKVSQQSAAQSLAQSQNSVIESVLNIYIQILYCDEAIKVQQNALTTLEAQRDRSKGLYNAGSISISDYAQVEAQYSAQNYSVVSAQNSARDYRMQLCQLMGIPVDLSLNVSSISYDSAAVMAAIPDYMSIYQAALSVRPEVKSRELAIESANYNIKTARAGFYPTISLGASVGTANGEKSSLSFVDQVKNNWSNSVGMSLNVPIMTGRKNKSALEKAKLRKSSSEIELQSAKDQLLWNIERVWLNAINAQENYKAAKAKVEAVEQSYALVAKQFEVGLKNPTDLLAQKDELLSAQQALLQSKYTAIYNINLLRFYAGERFL
ncbi:MAG: TolC family protein [Paludibacteraceae bacterium]|nr:TolC family protein [Paludibacteraceae bacterium]MBP5742678.1 TolC family protein [Paludibacteraceae bacterium]